ncbi:stage III sporulation protein AD [Thermodesulfitimonas autotrophica]|uniref:Stage III sporulation protein AD n=1 Tax=Thermodesulfitimonas autotrophica TaxID=1894989 RepID=A0A3N5BNK3_9THEO|nr:stage III sporulation protein AD [Thermodesulfitimonas autotrophica]RPF49242.1 stage III sporulation protein AD [Thermodesulfitimonas autotrophica]
MNILQVVGFALIAAVLTVVLRREKPELALGVAVTAGVIIFLGFVGKIGAVVTVVSGVANRAGLNMVYLDTILKIVGIAYLADFGAQICRDAGEGALATKVEFAAKVLILMLALPIVAGLLDLLLKLVV